MRRLLIGLSAVSWVVAGWWMLRPMPPEHPERVAPLFALVDLDGDGVVSRSEAAQVGGPDLDFALLDLDGNGALGPGEVEASLWTLDPAWWILGPE